MQQLKKKIVFMILLAFITGLAACGGGTTATTDDTEEDTPENEDNPTELVEISSSEDAIANIPTSNPTAIDYALADVEAQLSSKSLSSSKFIDGEDPSINIKVVSVDEFSFKIYQCMNGEQTGYAEYTYNPDTLAYTGNVMINFDGQQYNLEGTIKNLAMTDADFSGSVTAYDQYSIMIIGADGATQTNSFQAQKIHGEDIYNLACQWNETVGCSSYEFGAVSGGVPFAIVVDGATKEKSGTDTEDESLCENLPDYPTVQEVAGFTGEQVWDCTIPEGETAFEPNLAANELEAAGGSYCSAQTDFWQDADTDPSSCFTQGEELTSEGAACLCNSLYAQQAQMVRFTEQMFVCSVKGIFALAKEGNEELADLAIENGGTVYVNLTGIFGDDDGEYNNEGGDDVECVGDGYCEDLCGGLVEHGMYADAPTCEAECATFNLRTDFCNETCTGAPGGDCYTNCVGSCE